jgi:aerobic-type carbon monoxide dehydrogenase small subunit (CoxS/CutS family)
MRLTVNRQPHDVDAPPSATLLSVLRDRLHLTGAKLVCGRGECGACTVLVDGAPAYACLTLAAACEGSEVTTIEGIGTAESLHPLQRAFVAEDALQCGYCTPGQILAAMALLAREPRPDEAAIRRGMSGNLCRCGTYPKIVRAVQAAAAEMAESP